MTAQTSVKLINWLLELARSCVFSLDALLVPAPTSVPPIPELYLLAG